MKTSSFRIVPLPTEIADAARRGIKAGAADHALITVDEPGSAPCRHCLRWAQPDERVILFPYAAIPSGHPYSETGPIFVHANECQRYSATNEYPADFRNGRVFRAYDSNYNIIDAQVMNSSEPEVVVESLFQNPDTAFVDVRSVTRGCFTFRVQRGMKTQIVGSRCSHGAVSPCLVPIQQRLDTARRIPKFLARISSMHQRL